MTAKEFRRVQDTVDNEGFEYAFLHYSDFTEIKDPEFHKLREAYLAAQKALAEYIGVEDD